MPHVFLVWTTAGDRARFMWHFLCDGINTSCICLWWAFFVFQFALYLHYLFRWGVRRFWLLFVLFFTYWLFGKCRCSCLFGYLSFLPLLWSQASDATRVGNIFAILFWFFKQATFDFPSLVFMRLMIMTQLPATVEPTCGVFALTAGITISKKGTHWDSGTRSFYFFLFSLILGECGRWIEGADGWREFYSVICVLGSFIWLLTSFGLSGYIPFICSLDAL